MVDLVKAREKAVLQLRASPLLRKTPVRAMWSLSSMRARGDDPGAIGPKELRKTVVLAIAKALQKEANRHSGYLAILTRGGDYYLAHRERTPLLVNTKRMCSLAFMLMHGNPGCSGRLGLCHFGIGRYQ